MFLPTHAGKAPSRRRPWTTWSLAAVCVLVFIAELQADSPQRMVELLGLVPARLGHVPDGFHGVLTHAFLHGGWAHLLGNLWFLLVFGAHVEARMGNKGTLALFLWCAVAGGLVHAAGARGSTVPLVGASGAISGLMGAAWWLQPGARMGVWLVLVTVHTRVWVFVAAWGGWQVVQAFTGMQHGGGGGVAFFAHVGGLCAGLAVAAVSRAGSAPVAARPSSRRRG